MRNKLQAIFMIVIGFLFNSFTATMVMLLIISGVIITVLMFFTYTDSTTENLPSVSELTHCEVISKREDGIFLVKCED